MQHRHTLGQGRGNRRVVGLVGGLVAAREVVQKQHRIRLSNLVPRTLDADLFNHVHLGAVAQTGGVDHVHRHALDLNGLLHHVARGARDRRDDGELSTRQGIEQGALARVGLTGDHHR